jgi:hypothetical protein
VNEVCQGKCVAHERDYEARPPWLRKDRRPWPGGPEAAASEPKELQ